MAHDHGAPHGHSPALKNFGGAFALAAALNLGLVAIQMIYGLAANSVALLADAAHNFGDVLGLLVAWGAHAAGRSLPTARYTYGLRSASILATLCNAVMLLVATGAIAWEAVQRFPAGDEVHGLTVMLAAAAGIAVNGLSAWLLAAGRRADLNIRAAIAHLAADAGVSAGVVVAATLIMLTGWSWIDPAASLIIAGVIVWGTWGMLWEAVRLSMNAVPAPIDPAAVRSYLESLAGVASVHDLHIWAMSTTENALTAHVVLPGGHPGDMFLDAMCRELDRRFRIQHPTIQIELGDAGHCALEPATTI
jgi:cobalt-zinc-cadmium efflux system protein